MSRSTVRIASRPARARAARAPSDGRRAVLFVLALLGVMVTAGILYTSVRAVLDATRADAAPGANDVSGLWILEDTVTAGSGTGTTYRFAVDLEQEGDHFKSTGKGLAISGTTEGEAITATFQLGEQTGQFAWTVQPNGTLAGTFTTEDGTTSGTSVLLPVR